MSYDPTAPRMFAPESIGRTSSERHDARRFWAERAGTLFDMEPVALPDRVCHVCGSPDHDVSECAYGSAPSLFAEVDDDQADGDPVPDPAEVRAMFARLGWAVTQ